MTTPIITTGAAGPSLDERFCQLVQEWQAGTAGLSSPRALAGHPAYQEIIALGEPALPLIFRHLREHGGWWYPALRALTGANPVPESARGNRAGNDEAWLRWGQENGYAQAGPVSVAFPAELRLMPAAMRCYNGAGRRLRQHRMVVIAVFTRSRRLGQPLPTQSRYPQAKSRRIPPRPDAGKDV